MTVIRSIARAKVRSTPITRTGTTKAGAAYAIREVEVIDADDNKIALPLRDGLAVELLVGKFYDFTIDSQADFRSQASVKVVDAKPVG